MLLAYIIKKQIHNFIYNTIGPKLQQLCPFLEQKLQQTQFVAELSTIQKQFQKFAYALNFYTQSLNIFSSKAASEFIFKFFDFLTSQKAFLGVDETDEQFFKSISNVPIMATQLMKQYLDQTHLYNPLLEKIKLIFCNFNSDQRRNGAKSIVERMQMNQCIQFVQSLHYNHESECQRIGDNQKIVYKQNKGLKNNKKSTAAAFFKINFMQNILLDIKQFYQQIVQKQLLPLPAEQQIKQILSYMETQRIKSYMFIHDPTNQDIYLKAVINVLGQCRRKQREGKSQEFKLFLKNIQKDLYHYID